MEQRRVIRTGKLRIGGAELDCYVVQVGNRIERLVSQRTTLAHLGKNVSGSEWRKNATISSDSLLAGLANDIRSRLPESYTANAARIEPIAFEQPITRRIIQGVRGEDIVEFCDLVIEASNHAALIGGQAKLVDRAWQVVRACARVGITALIDEATGYQRERGGDELQRILDRLLAPEPQTWERRFPPDFYTEICRLRGWRYHPENPAGGFATITNDIVYSRLAPGVLEALRELNPIDGKRRQRRHHQHLSTEDGARLLAEHLRDLVTLANGAYGWPDFMRTVDRRFPRVGTQFSLPVEGA